MRMRLLVVLFALVAMTLAPPESVLADSVGSVGSVVGQVASCVEPGAVLRDAGARIDTCVEAFGRLASPRSLDVVVVAGLVALVALCTRRRRGRASLSAPAWRLVDAAAGATAPWRAPPVPV